MPSAIHEPISMAMYVRLVVLRKDFGLLSKGLRLTIRLVKLQTNSCIRGGECHDLLLQGSRGKRMVRKGLVEAEAQHMTGRLQ